MARPCACRRTPPRIAFGDSGPPLSGEGQTRGPVVPPSPDAAIMAAREAAKSASTLDELRALLDRLRRLRAARHRDPARIRRRQSAGAHHVRRRGAGTRRGHCRPAFRRPFGKTARPHDGGDRARPHDPPTSPTSFRGGRPETAIPVRRKLPSACPSSAARSSLSIPMCWSASASLRRSRCSTSRTAS